MTADVKTDPISVTFEGTMSYHKHLCQCALTNACPTVKYEMPSHGTFSLGSPMPHTWICQLANRDPCVPQANTPMDTSISMVIQDTTPSKQFATKHLWQMLDRTQVIKRGSIDFYATAIGADHCSWMPFLHGYARIPSMLSCIWLV